MKQDADPQILNFEELLQEIEHRYPVELRGKGLSATVDLAVDVSETGQISNVRIVQPVIPGGFEVTGIGVDQATGKMIRLSNPGVSHYAFVEAAITAIKVARFSPARRNGAAVPRIGHRVSVAFRAR